MNIEWLSFLTVTLVTLIGSLSLVALYSFAVRLKAIAEDEVRGAGLAKSGAVVCFVLCGCLVLLGIYLIVPQLGGSGGH
ncbi:MAG: hypothetical protein ACTHWW_03860 [Arthrobacter sp.]|uniref:hypothetical protein n=1 Tax=unclassified Arthrobacter TaxID=235627 RepID=UPI00264EC906|nr:hypothetical protein [Micrococcaceae bacterium]MDN5824912.1 hypothetical protein [Micrococcaceae bacterium]MDN5878105.1 hypothetical protein [Micrococcaceae bacterium]MDN5885858.1 hypothetical protein [Micrococcaceae bacterium]MDN5904196.1 hypothetical protein [Micrococcaceae bacterium]